MPRVVLAVGAYERDNFGDFLFLEVIKRSLPEDCVVAGSIMYANTDNNNGPVTVPYDYALNSQQFNAVFVVGGEIGGVDTSLAVDMSFNDKAQKIRHTKTSYTGFGGIVDSLYGVLKNRPCAYVPDMREYPLNLRTPLIINSVGIALFAESKEAEAIARSASFISVRDPYSASVLKGWGIKASTLAPDVVHVLPTVYRPKKRNNTYILVQFNNHLAQTWGDKTLEKMLGEIHARYKEKIVLLVAGSAKGHDSIKLYKRLVASLEGTCEIEIAALLPSLEVVNLIAGAKATLSTSLHVRIVSAGYGVARVSIENEKVTRYVREWDDAYPYNVGSSEIVDALDNALNQRRANPRAAINTAATNLAKKNLANALDRITNHKMSFDEAHFYNQSLVYMQDSVLRDIARCAEHVHKRDSDMRLIQKQADDYHSQVIEAGKRIEEIINSNAWKWVTRYRSILHNARHGFLPPNKRD